ncbi:MAG: T9SS type A sorting domain-containing protein [Bacteroidales bacterium]|nr:T9SS type A sorting domain-containing protein [Bacteroidales bacterium]MCF8405946.1 T9SS type A sorting domain-containing protein [Bacteroidales bacterium]
MKKLFVIAGLLFFSYTSFGQLSIEHSFNYSANVTKLNSTTYKYFLMDVPAHQCRIYNLDYSLYKTINLPVPGGEWLYDIRFVSEDLFNEDSKIEVLYTYYKWVAASGTASGYYIYHTKVINEDGTLLLDVPGALYSYVKEVSPDEYSLFLYAYDFSVDPYTIWTSICKLPGVLNTIEESKKSGFSIDGFPNPASSYVNVEYVLPPHMETAYLHLVDASGKEKAVYLVDGFTNFLRLETENFSPGVYFYFIENDGERSEANKLVIQ